MAPKKTARPAAENISLGPSVREGELVFGTLCESKIPNLGMSLLLSTKS